MASARRSWLRAAGAFRRYNDAQLTAVSPAVVQKAEAFILLYERQGEGAEGGGRGGDRGGRGGDHGGRGGDLAAVAAPAPPAAPVASASRSPAAPASISTLTVVEKAARRLKKALSQIDELKQSEAEGATLQPNQREKVAKEAELRAELEALELQSRN